MHSISTSLLPPSHLQNPTFTSTRGGVPKVLAAAASKGQHRHRKRKSRVLRTDDAAAVTNEGLSRVLRTEATLLGIRRRAAAAMVNARSKRRLSPRAVLQALDEAVKSGDWETALQVFKLLRNQLWYKPNSQTYARLTALLGKCGRAEEAKKIFHLMRSEGFEPTLNVYTSLAGAYGRGGRIEEAFQLLDEMKILQCRPNEYMYTVLINACVKLRLFDRVVHLLDEMCYMGIESNVVTYNSVIDGYGKAGLIEEMEGFLCTMLEEGKCVPDLCTMNSVLWAFGNEGKLDEMEKWYDEFQVMGIEPDVQTFNVLIKSYGKGCDYGKMISVFRYMKKRYFTPTVITYNLLIECFGRNGEIKNMEYYFRLMKIKGVKPNSITYCSLVNGYSNAKMLYKISGVIRQTLNSDVILDAPFYNCVINAFGKAKEVKIMEDIFSLMKDKGCKPDRITFETMIRVYDSCGMDEAAKSLEMKINEAGHKLLV